MSLKRDDHDTPMTVACPHCRHRITRAGSWFAYLRNSFKCPECSKQVVVTYDDKLRLFRKYSTREG